jgi:hypothetical protein
MAKINYKVLGTKPPFTVKLMSGEVEVATNTHYATGEGAAYSFDGVANGDYNLNIIDNVGCTHNAPITVGTNSTDPIWSDNGEYRCVVDGNGLNTGEQEKQQIDSNLSSNTFGQTRWVSTGQNPTACPIAQEPTMKITARYEVIESTGDYLNVRWIAQADVTNSVSRTITVTHNDGGAVETFTIDMAPNSLETYYMYVHYKESQTKQVSFTIMEGANYIVGQPHMAVINMTGLGGGKQDQ